MRDIDRVLSDWYRGNLGWDHPCLSINRHVDGPFFARAYRDHPTYFITARDKAGGTRTDSVLKICGSEGSAREEFQALVELTQHFRNLDGPFGVPTPLGVFPSLPGLLMSRVTGDRLSKILWPFSLSPNRAEHVADLLAGIRSAASWLVAYQRMAFHKGDAHTLSGAAEINQVEDDLHTQLDLCREYGLNLQTVEAIDDWFSHMKDSITDLTSTCVPICDFQPTHVFLSETRTSVIDFEEPRCGWPGQNLASFVAYCQVYARPVLPTAVSTDRVCRTFLESYASQVEFGPVHQASLEVAFVLDLLETFLRRWTDQEQRWIKNGVLLWRSWLAKREMTERASTGTWQTILKQNWHQTS